jgi:membrane protease subunit HflK
LPVSPWSAAGWRLNSADNDRKDQTMPWTNQGGGGPWGGGGGSGGSGGGGGPGPWGRGPGGVQPPDLEDLLRRGQDRLRSVVPGNFGGKGIVLVALVGVGIWLASGFYKVQPDEVGLVLRFGEYVRRAEPGLNYHLPAPIESVIKPSVTRVNRTEVGFRTGETPRQAGRREINEESLMLTGDENIVDIRFVVFWSIKNAGDFVFKVRNQEPTIKVIGESVIRDIIGRSQIQRALTDGRGEIEQRTRDMMQLLTDSYGLGVDISEVRLQESVPPAQVIDAFDDVTRAKTDKERLKNEAEAYRNEVVPRARGESEKLLAEARAYKEEVVNRADGDAKRFLSVYEAYKIAKDVTTQRIYLETMEQVMRSANKVIIDKSGEGGSGVVPYLPLPEIQKRAQERKP